MPFLNLKKCKILVILLIFFKSVFAFAKNGNPPLPKTAINEQTTHIDIVDNTVIIKAMINGKGPYRFFLDTGSSGSYVSEKVAKSLKLPFESSRHVMLNETPHEFNYYRIQSFKIGNAEIQNFDVGVTPLLNMVNQKFSNPKDRVDGVIGFDAFDNFLFTLNIKDRTITLKAGKLNLRDPNTFAFEYHVPALCIMPITVRDAKGIQRKFKVLIDTGENSQAPSITMPISVHSIPFEVTSKKGIDYVQMTRVDSMYQSQIKGEAIIGSIVFKNPILVHHGKPFEGIETYDYGLVGMGIIKSLVITFDQKSSLVKIESSTNNR